tara:strand:+ start:1388 stop:1669 length:282 start_codon:yes stop_codon:yes gene_type:complete
MHQAGLFGLSDHLKRLSAYGDPLKQLDQIIDFEAFRPALVAAPKHRNTADEKDAIKPGKPADEIWPDESARAAQKDTDARWTLKFTKASLFPL